MLTKISLENFMSFERTAELTMVSSAKIKKNTDYCIQIKNTKLLCYAVVFGANASGKTNLIEFFRFFMATLEDGLPAWSTKLFNKNHAENENKDSMFELQFSVNDTFLPMAFMQSYPREG